MLPLLMMTRLSWKLSFDVVLLQAGRQVVLGLSVSDGLERIHFQ